MEDFKRANISKAAIKYCISNIKKDFYNIETVKRGEEYILTIYPMALSRNLNYLQHRMNVKLLSCDKLVYKYTITGNILGVKTFNNQ